ncbi:MAG: hypothetical protein VKK04_00525 [Synechococcales bacterium]|nr:hypothetical protein [Synechococcales bacterium]
MATNIFPTRSFIRFKAKSQLIADLSGHSVVAFINRPGDRSAEDGTAFSPIAPQNTDDEVSTDPVCVNFEALDESLLRDIASTLFHPSRHPELYESCESRSTAMEIESAIAAEIVNTYKHIKRKEYDPAIQELNSLL